jgi:hypothetical protein
LVLLVVLAVGLFGFGAVSLIIPIYIITSLLSSVMVKD